MPLHDGERQVAPTLEGIRRDHVARYEFVARKLTGRETVVDCGCGVGYGANILARVAGEVFAFDRDREAIEYAEKHYSYGGTTRLRFSQGDADRFGEFQRDVAVAFEIVEHIEDPRPLLRDALRGCNTLFASVPNEKVFPFKNYAFHHRHYTREEFEALLNECGWIVEEWWGQLGPESDVERDVEGRTLVVKARRVALAKPGAADAKPSRAVPRHVAIVALGSTAEAYMDHVKRLGNRRAYADEVWAINAMGDVIACDLVFHMDDVRIQEIRAAARPDSNIAAMLQFLKSSKVPVMTSRAHPDYPALIEFPFEEVANALGEVYFNNTVAYAVAYAIYRGVERISLFGCDYTYTNKGKGEAGRACVEYWLGFAAARGIAISTNPQTPLLDSHKVTSDDDVYAYGYDTLKIGYSDDNGRMKFSFTPRATLPTADQIEKAYDHGRPPHEQHGRMAAE